MKITAIQLENVRGFQKLIKTDFSDTINILVGPNNAGKSTIIKSIYKLQNGKELNVDDITHGKKDGKIELFYRNPNLESLKKTPIGVASFPPNKVVFKLSRNITTLGYPNDSPALQIDLYIDSFEPDNLIYPYLSKRKVTDFDTDISATASKNVSGNLKYLYAKIDKVNNPQSLSVYNFYKKACNEILGFEVTTIPSDTGKKAVYLISGLDNYIPLTSMGEGVINILGLVCDLCIAENKIFLIEEIENDIHPKALKALLNLIAEKSDSNQFFISTHSNIVMKQLGSLEGSKVFKITNKESDPNRPNLFYSKMEEIQNNPAARMEILEELGYEFYDFALWKGWLILEESSAEVIIRDYLIKWFVPELLPKLRTFSAGTANQVEKRLKALNELFVFLHLEPSYKNKVWVIIDAGEKEEKIISDLKETYVRKNGWNDELFKQFSNHDFELYYPKYFEHKVTAILKIEDSGTKRTRKKELIENVKDWIAKDETTAKNEFEQSAAEVIAKLKEISESLSNQK